MAGMQNIIVSDSRKFNGPQYNMWKQENVSGLEADDGILV
jgi:hypothetical protein